MHCILIEDDFNTAKLIADALRMSGFDVVHCPDIKTGEAAIAVGSYDVVILDRMLPDGDGLNLLSKMHDQGDVTPVLVLSALSSLDERVRALRSGGDDYLAKPFAIDELLARLEALVRRSTRNGNDEILIVEDLRVDTRRRKVFRNKTQIQLQPREFRLLEYMVRNQGKILSRRMLLEFVWDYRFDPQSNVIDVHMSRLRQKIDKDFSPTLIHTIRSIGFTLNAAQSGDSDD